MGSSGSVRQQRFRKILVGAQVALSVALLAGAALLIASFVRLSHQLSDSGPIISGSASLVFRKRVIPMKLRGRVSWNALTEALRAIPGFERAASAATFRSQAASAGLFTHGLIAH